MCCYFLRAFSILFYNKKKCEFFCFLTINIIKKKYFAMNTCIKNIKTYDARLKLS